MDNFMTNVNSFGGNFFGFLTHITDLLVGSVQKLAEQAGVLLTHLWVIFTRQQLILGLQELLGGLAMIIGGLISFKYLRRYAKDKKMNGLDRFFLLVILFILTLWLVVHGTQLGIASLPRLLNPEYYALQESIELLKQIPRP